MDDGGKRELLGDREQQFGEKFARLEKFEEFEKLTPAAGLCPPTQ